MSVAGAALLVLGLSVRIEGPSTCPTPDDVDRRVRGLLPIAAADTPADVAHLIPLADGLSVQLRNPQGDVVAERHFPSGFSCADLAGAVAVAVASWESDVHPEFAPTLGAAPRPPEPAGPPPPVLVAARSPWMWEAGLGVAGTVAPRGGDAATAPGLLAFATAGRDSWWLAPRTDFVAHLDRVTQLPAGRALWGRTVWGLGAEANILRGRVDLLLRCAGLVGWFRVRGDGINDARSASSLDTGFGAGLRARVVRGAWVVWVDAAAAGWLDQQEVAVLGPSLDPPPGASVKLSPFDFWLTVGFGARARLRP